MAEQQPNWWQVKNHDQLTSKMTKREMFAAMAMQGILASLTEDDVDFSCRSIARSALCNADALLAELEKAECAT